MTKSLWHGQLRDGLATMGLSLDEERQEKLLAFLGLLNKWNRAYNLTAVRDEREMVSRQLLDSLSILPWITAEHLLDVGAGGGLPKTRFLNQCVLELGLDNVEVIHGRAEDCSPPEPFAQISSRAFTALENLVNWCGDLLANEGEFLAMKGQFPDDEVAALPAGWQVKSSHPLDVPGADGERHLLVVARATISG